MDGRLLDKQITMIFKLAIIVFVRICDLSREKGTILLKSIILSYFIGASLSEPHIDDFAVDFLYIYYVLYIIRRAVSHFRLLFCEFLRHSLIQKLFTNILSEKS